MPASSISNIPPKIVSALKQASRATGADFDYLLKTAARESAFKPGAKARTSSASGLFQFIEQTWLGTLKTAGGQHGLGKLSGMIHQDRNGKFHVTDPSKRKALLALRFDPKLSALMAGEFTRSNQAALRQKIGRPPTDGELYIGHFLGAGKAARLINMAAKAPNVAADAHFPRAARANKAIFYGKSGKPRSVAAVYRNLTRHYSNQIAAAADQTAAGKSGAAVAGRRAEAPPAAGPVRPLTQALFTLWRTPANAASAGQGAASSFHNLFLPGQAGADGKPPAASDTATAPGAIYRQAGGSGAVRGSDSGPEISDKPASHIPSAAAFLSAFGAGTGDAGQSPPETRTAAGRINGVWGQSTREPGLLARRRTGAK